MTLNDRMNELIAENERLKAERIEILTKFGELNRDKLRLDLLDEVNAGFNEQNGTLYGWVVEWNHNRICLRDSDPMKKSVRQAIDEFALRVNKAGE